ncbi:MAG TPA: ABC transporter permease [Acidimicrobiia bacterium]|jgi:ABC-2 type transport system permease protein
MVATFSRSLRAGFWLGWKIESNWTDPVLFFIYSVARPLGAAFILVAMFFAVSGGKHGPLLDYFVIGSAFWPFVLAGLTGMAMAVLEDREHWKMIRPVYTSPISWPSYLVGRALALTASVGAGGAAVTLAVAALVLRVPFDVSPGDLAYLTVALALGLASVIALGLLAVAVALSVSREAWHIPEAISASLYLVSGAIFPVDILPGPLRVVSEAMPLTWWLEALRRGLLPAGARVSFPALAQGEVLGLLAVSTTVSLVLALIIFTWAERRARRLGILDRESGF